MLLTTARDRVARIWDIGHWAETWVQELKGQLFMIFYDFLIYIYSLNFLDKIKVSLSYDQDQI